MLFYKYTYSSVPLPFKKFITKSINISFSLGFDSAIKSVIATKALLSITFSLSLLYSILLKFKKYINSMSDNNIQLDESLIFSNTETKISFFWI